MLDILRIAHAAAARGSSLVVVTLQLESRLREQTSPRHSNGTCYCCYDVDCLTLFALHMKPLFVVTLQLESRFRDKKQVHNAIVTVIKSVVVVVAMMSTA